MQEENVKKNNRILRELDNLEKKSNLFCVSKEKSNPQNGDLKNPERYFPLKSKNDLVELEKELETPNF